MEVEALVLPPEVVKIGVELVYALDMLYGRSPLRGVGE